MKKEYTIKIKYDSEATKHWESGNPMCWKVRCDESGSGGNHESLSLLLETISGFICANAADLSKPDVPAKCKIDIV